MTYYKTSELEGELLNQAVAKANAEDAGVISYADYCGMWEYGGPIIEREKISLFYDVWWEAGINAELSCLFGSASLDARAKEKGDTALVAAMRCFVMAKIGDEVEL